MSMRETSASGRSWIVPVVVGMLFLALGIWFIATASVGPGIGFLVVAGAWTVIAIVRHRRAHPKV